MDQRRFKVDRDVRLARTLPGAFYSDPQLYRAQLERIFCESWQLIPGPEACARRHSVLPFDLLPGSVDEPLLLTRDGDDTLRCLSNVCTHRGNLLVDCPGEAGGLRCRYHGRRFDLSGKLNSMPEFEQTRDFPSKADDLPQLPVRDWGPLRFCSLGRSIDFDAWIEPVRSRMDWIEANRLVLDPQTSTDYVVQAHWALYCDNYLEGFHIPFVHHGLASVLDYGAYRTELFDLSSVQIGIAAGNEAVFVLPESHVDAGRRVAAYYFFLFPNLMLNFYPWGLSLNVVEPLGLDRTRVRFLSYVGDPGLREAGAGSDLHRVELEDEQVVANVQRGMRSRLFRRGRFSATRETGVHQFHRLLSARLFGSGAGGSR